MKIISIDLETFAEADLNKTGVYRYADDPSFEILLFGYAVDGGDVHVVDLAMGETIPAEVLDALTDDGVIKIAHNANFERVCLSRYLSDLGISLDPFYDSHPLSTECARYLNPAGWRCTMVWGAYLGLPLSLAGAGTVLGLERQKLDTGKDLIRYFCQPCKPTEANGHRTRNRPSDALEKWAQFKAYNRRDVETEMEIEQRLSNYPVPDEVWDQYHIDQKINDRGIAIDRQLVENAIRMDTRSRAELTEMMQKLTHLDNPNSVQQMKQWLINNGLEIDSLGKKQVQALLQDAPPQLREVLLLRQQLARSSVKKYIAMKNAVCADGRVRGMFQFYGAVRTGRWCLTGDHEILTPEGWVRLDAWNGGLIACWNCSTEAVSFQNANQVNFPYTGPMYTYRDCRIDQCSTPDHKMRVQRRYGCEWQDMTVAE
ncbi:MAG: DNA polymerase, partial [bacterium]